MVDSSRSRPADSQRAVPMENMRGIAEHHIGDRGAALEGLSPQSYGKHAEIALFSDSGAPGAAADGADVETERVVNRFNYRGAQGLKKKEVGRVGKARPVKSLVPRRPKPHGSYRHCSGRQLLSTNWVSQGAKVGRLPAGDPWRYGVQLHGPRRRKDVPRPTLGEAHPHTLTYRRRDGM